MKLLILECSLPCPTLRIIQKYWNQFGHTALNYEEVPAVLTLISYKGLNQGYWEQSLGHPGISETNIQRDLNIISILLFNYMHTYIFFFNIIVIVVILIRTWLNIVICWPAYTYVHIYYIYIHILYIWPFINEIGLLCAFHLIYYLCTIVKKLGDKDI